MDIEEENQGNDLKPASKPKGRLRLFRFGLRSLLLLTLIFSLTLAYFNYTRIRL